MDAGLIWDAAWKIGLPFAMVLTALISGKAGVWVWGRELAKAESQFEVRLKELAQRGERELRDKDDELKFFRGIAFSTLDQAREMKNQARGAVTMAEQAVNLVEQRGARRQS